MENTQLAPSDNRSTKSADGRVATEAAWLNGKMKESLRESEITLDTDRPSHGRTYRDFGRKNTVFFPAVEREPHDSWRPGGHFPKCSRRTRPQLQVARAMSESLSIKEAHVWIVSISTETKNALSVK